MTSRIQSHSDATNVRACDAAVRSFVVVPGSESHHAAGSLPGSHSTPRLATVDRDSKVCGNPDLHPAGGDATADCCDSCDRPPSHDTSRIAWGKLMARVG